MKKFLVLLFVLFLLAACSSAEQAPTPIPTNTALPPTLTPIPPTDTPSPTDTPTPTDTLIPTATPTPFVPKATIKIASQSSLSLVLVDIGTDIIRGAELATWQLAGPLMDLGYKVEFVPYDDQTDYGVAVDVAKQIISDPEVLCVVGPMTSNIFKQVKEIYHRAGLAFISPSATAPVLNERRYLEANRLLGGGAADGMAGAQFAEAQGYSRVFILNLYGDDFSQISAYNFRNEASRMGIEITGYMATESTEGFGKLIDRLMAANTDLVYFSTWNVGQAGNFFREARAAGYMGAFLNNASDPALLESAGPLLIDGGGMYYTTATARANYYSGAAGFLENFETLYGTAPQGAAAPAYDAAGICMKAIEQASIAKGGEIPTRAEVANAIRSLQNYQGITGTYNFNKFGNPDPVQYFVFQVISSNPAEWDQNVIVNSFLIDLPE